MGSKHLKGILTRLFNFLASRTLGHMMMQKLAS